MMTPSIRFFFVLSTLLLLAIIGHAQCQFNSFWLTGGGSTCGGAQTVTLTLAYSSETDVYYQLKLDGSLYAGTEQLGTGMPLQWNVTLPGTYTVRARRGSCLQDLDGVAFVTSDIMPNPVISVSGSGCSTTLTASGGTSYEWRYNDPSGSPMSTAWAIQPKQSGTYYLKAYSECGWNAQVSYNFILNPVLQIAPSGLPVDVCPGTLTLTATGGSNYSWVLPNGSSMTGTSIIATLPGTYTLHGSNACGIPESTTIPVTFNTTSPYISFTSVPTFVCRGTATTWLTVNTNGAVAYSIANAGSSTINHQGIITWDPGFSGTARITATATICASVVSTAVDVPVKAPIPYIVGGGGTTCGGSRSVPVVLNYSQTGYTYRLKLNGSSYGSDLNGNEGPLTWSVTAAGTYTVEGYYQNCAPVAMSSSAVVTSDIVMPTISIAGSGCAAVLTANGGSSYAWRLNDSGGPVISTASSIQPQRSGVYYVTATSDCGVSAPVSYNFFQVPQVQISPSGLPQNVCPGTLSLQATGGSNYQWSLPGGGTSTAPSLTVNTGGVYGLSGKNICNVTEQASITVTVRGVATSPQTQDKKIKYNTSTLLTASGAVTGETYQWYNALDQPLPPGNTYPTPALVTTTLYKVSKSSATLCESSKAPLLVTVNKIPVVSVGEDKTVVLPASEVTLSATATDPDADALTYAWTKLSGPAFSGSSTSNSFPVTGLSVGTYVFRCTVADGWDMAEDDIQVAVVYPPNNYNWVKETTVQVEGITDINLTDALEIDNGQKGETWKYFDGLGRSVQVVGTRQSPGRKDVVQPIVYNELGMEEKKYLPYTGGTNGFHKTDALTAQHQFYQAQLPESDDRAHPYAHTMFEASPLHRVAKQGTAGTTWQPDQDVWSTADHTVKKRYETNGSQEVLLFMYTPATGLISLSSIAEEKYYEPDQLFANRTLDENNNEVIEYVDKEGRTVCKKVQYKIDAQDPSVKLYTSTYYIYDDLGNLSVVLPPEAVRKMEANIGQN